MRMTRFLVMLLALFATTVRAQNVDEIKKCVAFIFGRTHILAQDGSFVRGPDGKPLVVEGPLGTAFFVGYPDDRGGTNFSFAYIVTAKHVLRDADGTYLKSVKLRVNLVKPQAASDLTFGEIPVTDENGRLLWYTDTDDPQNDVAVIPGMPDVKIIDSKFVPVAMFADADLLQKRKVQEGDSVYLFGLMPQYYGEKRNYPVVRRGALALLTDEAIQTGPNTRQHAYLAELASWPGNSGAPVFLDLAGLRAGSLIAGSDYHLLGLMLGYFSNTRQAQIVEAQTVAAVDPSNIGISFILPAATIRKVLESPPLQHLRDQEIEKLKSNNSAPTK